LGPITLRISCSVNLSTLAPPWSTPERVNRDPEGGSSPNVDHFEPALAADSTGRIAVCFYDRRNDAANFLIDRYCASSTNGKKWTNSRITLTQFSRSRRPGNPDGARLYGRLRRARLRRARPTLGLRWQLRIQRQRP